MLARPGAPAVLDKRPPALQEAARFDKSRRLPQDKSAMLCCSACHALRATTEYSKSQVKRGEMGRKCKWCVDGVAPPPGEPTTAAPLIGPGRGGHGAVCWGCGVPPSAHRIACYHCERIEAAFTQLAKSKLEEARSPDPSAEQLARWAAEKAQAAEADRRAGELGTRPPPHLYVEGGQVKAVGRPVVHWFCSARCRQEHMPAHERWHEWDDGGGGVGLDPSIKSYSVVDGVVAYRMA